MTTPMDDHYKTLGLAPGATRSEIKKAYKSQEKILHSDRFSDDPALRSKANEKYKAIKEAFEKLTAAAPAPAASRPEEPSSAPSQGSAAQKAPAAKDTVKCPGCHSENKETAKTCRKCGRDMTVPPAWLPDAAWHLKTLGTIYVALTIFYFGVTAVLSKLPRPYQLRHIPIEMTPWLVPGGKVHLPEDQLKAPPEPPAPAAPATK